MLCGSHTVGALKVSQTSWWRGGLVTGCYYWENCFTVAVLLHSIMLSLRERRLNILVFCASIPVFSASDYKRHCWYSDTGACLQRCCSSAVRHCSICVNFEDIIVQCVACIVHTVKCPKSMGHMCCPSSLIAISFDRSIYAIASKISCTDFPLYKILHW